MEEHKEIRKPAGIDERPEQFRPPIIKANGTTASERYLAQLAEKSFLNLWSYPNPFRDQKLSGGGDGKELCDLLVICGQYIIIFSEKTIGWPNGDLCTAWNRWSKRAIRDASKQIKGAERWITEYPDRIFLDKDCTVPFPIDFPAPQKRSIHRIVVVKGAEEQCKKQFPDSSGSLIIKPNVKGNQHWPNKPDDAEPFTVGDLDPNGSFVHVIDGASLNIIMQELDTICDFTNYLEKKVEFIRSGRLMMAHGEENLLAYYAVRTNKSGEHDFVTDDKYIQVEIGRSHYKKFVKNPLYEAKKEANKVSYLWDMLIEAFTTHMLDGTSITLDGYEFDLRKNELGVRYMALQTRFERRNLGEAARDALEIGKTKDRFFRAMISPTDATNNETGFFILTMKYLDWMEEKGGYEKYRKKRTELATVYARGLLERHPHLERVVGISREPPDQGRGLSEDLVYAEQAEWTAEERHAIKDDCKTFGALQGRMKQTRRSDQEFPDVAVINKIENRPSDTVMNRKHRRMLAAKRRIKKS